MAAASNRRGPFDEMAEMTKFRSPYLAWSRKFLIIKKLAAAFGLVFGGSNHFLSGVRGFRYGVDVFSAAGLWSPNGSKFYYPPSTDLMHSRTSDFFYDREDPSLSAPVWSVGLVSGTNFGRDFRMLD